MVKQTIPVVQVAGLCKTFRDFWRRPRVEAVKDLNFEIQPGEVIGLLGPNGSGKSTTIKMLLGLLYPTRGRISIFGYAPTDVRVKARIGFLPEESYLYRFLVASEILDYYGRLFQIPGAIRRDRIERLLDMVGLSQEAKRPIGEYSKGMARRIGLAQALINDPEFLILDEPTSGLDPIGTRQIKDVIKELGRIGKTILLSSHVLADVEDVCDRVIILYGGQSRAEGTMDELLAQRNKTQIVTETLSQTTINRIRELIDADGGASPFEVTHPRDRLEDLFLRIVKEAQAANLYTRGVRAAGDLPTFLATPTQVETGEIISELISAASQPIRKEPPAKAAAEREGQKQQQAVLDDLLGVKPEGEADAPPSTSRPSLAASPKAPQSGAPAPKAPPVEADRGVLDSLLGGGSSSSQDKTP